MSIGPEAKSICKTLGKGSNKGKWDKHDSTRGSCVDQRLNVDDSTPMASIIDSIHNNFQFFVMTMTRSINVVLANPRFSGRFGNTGDSTRIASSITPSKYLILIFHFFFNVGINVPHQTNRLRLVLNTEQSFSFLNYSSQSCWIKYVMKAVSVCPTLFISVMIAVKS